MPGQLHIKGEALTVRVLIADDNPSFRKILKSLLFKWNYEVIEAEDGEHAWDILQDKASPRLVLADWMMLGLNGPDLCRRLRESGDNGYHYIILLTGKDSKEDIIAGLNAGADDYITKPFLPQELEVRLRVGARILALQESLEEALEMQRYQAQHDSLTGLLNQRETLRVLEQELGRAERQDACLAVFMVDVDNFKKVNDMYGHVAGDAVLVEVAKRMKKTIRLYDHIGRYGGDEFLLVLPGCSEEKAVQSANRLRVMIQTHPVLFQDQTISLTISLGVAFNRIGERTERIDIVQAADWALYQAKQKGRNRVETAIS